MASKLCFALFALISVCVSLPMEEFGIEGTNNGRDFSAEDDEANRNARFNFGYSIQDEISGGSVQRTEERNGLALTGEYSYSDGFFKRTVAYEADENGYRVTKMISEPIGNGPILNKMGRAIVQMLVSGVETQYAIQAQPMNADGTVPDEENVSENLENV